MEYPVDHSVLPFLLRRPQTIVKYEASTDQAMGCSPQDRTIHQALQQSLININKPKGPTSHQVADYVKKITGSAKTGHGGTLDPGVTGVLPVALNNASKIIQTFLLAGKEYVCYMKLHQVVAPEKLNQTCNAFIGDIRQMPPLKSAVKREWRTRRVYYLELLEHDGTDVLFRVGCQAGTYIRKLCTDMGEHLGVGAHMQQLVRTQSGPFSYQETVTLQDVIDAFAYLDQGDPAPLRAMLVPVEDAVSHLPKVWITDAAVASVSQGASLAMPGVVRFHDDIAKDAMIGIFSLKDELVALGRAQMDAITMKESSKGIMATPERVIIDKETYAGAKHVPKKDVTN